MIIIAITGITKTRVLIIHNLAFGSPFTLSLVPLIAMTKAAIPLAKATSNASNPRVRHPSTSTGDRAIKKNNTGIIEGINM
jgi:hypothetical protein